MMNNRLDTEIANGKSVTKNVYLQTTTSLIPPFFLFFLCRILAICFCVVLRFYIKFCHYVLFYLLSYQITNPHALLYQEKMMKYEINVLLHPHPPFTIERSCASRSHISLFINVQVSSSVYIIII